MYESGGKGGGLSNVASRSKPSSRKWPVQVALGGDGAWVCQGNWRTRGKVNMKKRKKKKNTKGVKSWSTRLHLSV